MSSEPQTAIRLLVVDDHDDSRDVLALSLEAAGFQVETAADAQSALRIARAQPRFDVLLTDLNLPDMSGEQLAEELCKDEQQRPRRLIAVSGRELSRDAQQAFHKTMIKPVDISKLPDQLRSLLASQSGPSVKSTRSPAEPAVVAPAAVAQAVTRPSAAPLSQAHAQLMLQQAPFMLWRIAKDGRCEWFNERWLAYTGSTPEQQLGQSAHASMHPEDQPRWQAALSAHAHGQTEFAIELRARRHDGQFGWLDARVAPLQEPPHGFVGWIVCCESIEEQKEREQQRARFLSSMAHELRTPLTPIGAYVHQLTRLSSKSEPPAPDMPSKLSRQMERLAHIADQLSDAARLELATPLSLLSEKVELRALISQVVREQEELSLRNRLPDVELRFASDLPEDDVTIWADKQRIAQLIRALVSNAAKFSPRGGQVRVQLVAGDPVRVTVEDRGIGIPEAELDKVGRGYFHASNAKAESLAGIGLGLALAKHIAEGHGGKLELESALHRGTTARVSLPRAGLRARAEL